MINTTIMILEELSKKDSIWRHTALRLTGNKDKADEIVQTMYLRMYDCNLDLTRINDNFIKVVILNLFKDSKKNLFKLKSLEECYQFQQDENTTNFSDTDLHILKEINKLSEDEKKLLELNYDYSNGKIAKFNEGCRIKVHRDLTKIRKKVLKNDFDKLYKNKRLKYKR